MRKLVGGMLVIGLALFAAPACYAASQDTVFDKAGDWFATMGKPQSEKDQILFERRTARSARRLSESVRKGAKKAGDDMEKAAKKMEKAFQ